MSHFTCIVAGEDVEGQLSPFCEDREDRGKDDTPATWDWWVVGGRWRGYFPTKNKAGKLGGPGVFGNKPKFDADQVRFGDIDWDRWRDIAEQEIRKGYRAIEKIFGKDKSKWWKPMKAFKKADNYWKQPHILDMRENPDIHFHPDRYLETNEYSWVIEARRKVGMPFAFIDKDGEWHEQATMGWWATTSNENDNYEEEWFCFLNSLKDDDQLTLVDCHI